MNDYEDWPDIRPDFCPWTGEDCGCIRPSCNAEDGYCGKIQQIINRKPTRHERKMCSHWKTCLLSIIDDCTGSWEECIDRDCRMMPVFVKIDQPLEIPQENIDGWIKALGGEDH